MGLLATVSRAFGYTRNIKMLDCMINFPAYEFTKGELCEAVGMNRQTFNKYFDLLEREGVVEHCRTIRRYRLYRVNFEHLLVKAVVEFEKLLR